MDDIVKKVSAKTGLSEEHSQVAVTMVIDWVKEKLPASVRGQVDGFISGGGDIKSAASGALGGLLGGS